MALADCKKNATRNEPQNPCPRPAADPRRPPGAQCALASEGGRLQIAAIATSMLLLMCSPTWNIQRPHLTRSDRVSGDVFVFTWTRKSDTRHRDPPTARQRHCDRPAPGLRPLRFAPPAPRPPLRPHAVVAPRPPRSGPPPAPLRSAGSAPSAPPARCGPARSVPRRPAYGGPARRPAAPPLPSGVAGGVSRGARLFVPPCPIGKPGFKAELFVLGTVFVFQGFGVSTPPDRW